jgi:hypothetical protein
LSKIEDAIVPPQHLQSQWRSAAGEMARVRQSVADGLRSVGRVMRVVVGRLVVPGDETGVYGGGITVGRGMGGRMRANYHGREAGGVRRRVLGGAAQADPFWLGAFW